MGTALGAWIYKRGIRQWQILDIEMKSASLALTPLMLAERDRAFLKQLRKNRDAEEKLMGGVEGWEVGTFYGHKVYKTLKPDELPMVGFDEFYILPTGRSRTRPVARFSGLSLIRWLFWTVMCQSLIC